MLRPAVIVALTLLALSKARDPGCGGVEEKAGSVNAPCTRERDCERALRCERGVCVDPDAGAVDGGRDVNDGATSADAGNDG